MKFIDYILQALEAKQFITTNNLESLQNILSELSTDESIERITLAIQKFDFEIAYNLLKDIREFNINAI